MRGHIARVRGPTTFTIRCSLPCPLLRMSAPLLGLPANFSPRSIRSPHARVALPMALSPSQPLRWVQCSLPPCVSITPYTRLRIPHHVAAMAAGYENHIRCKILTKHVSGMSDSSRTQSLTWLDFSCRDAFINGGHFSATAMLCGTHAVGAHSFSLALLLGMCVT